MGILNRKKTGDPSKEAEITSELEKQKAILKGQDDEAVKKIPAGCVRVQFISDEKLYTNFRNFVLKEKGNKIGWTLEKLMREYILTGTPTPKA